MDRRRFSTLDAMILIAATAIGVGLVRTYLLTTLEDVPLVLTGWTQQAIFTIEAGITLPMAAWSFALLAIYLVPPRPPIRRLARSPGFAASLAGSVGAGLCLAVTYVHIYIRSDARFRSVQMYGRLINLPVFAGIAVITAWVMVAAGGGWRRRRGRDWRDRLGLALGWAWIAFYVAVIIVGLYFGLYH